MTREDRLLTVARKRKRGIIVVLEDIHDPHNAAAIMRTSDAFGVQDVWLVFEQEKPWNPRRVGKSSSSSANKWLSFRTFRSSAECLSALRAEGYVSAASVMDGETEIAAARFGECERLAIWLGNEHRGLSEGPRRAAAISVRIPMNGFVESLNVSVAAALIIYEAAKQRPQLLSEEGAAALAAEWARL